MTDVVDSTADELEEQPPKPEPERPGTELVHAPANAGAIIRAEEPDEIIAKASKIASSLADLIEKQGLAADVGGRKKHVEVSGWQALGTMLGALGGVPLHAETIWTRRVLDANSEPERTRYTATVRRYFKRDEGGGLRQETTYDVDGYSWEAKVEIRTPEGVVVGSAEAMCARDEETWNTRQDFALRSMAETRAESRAYRRAVGWIVSIAGYSPTPAEEMGHTPGADTQPARPAWAAPAPKDGKRKFLAALTDVLGGDEATAVEYAKLLSQSCGGDIPHVVVAWGAALPLWIKTGTARAAQPAPADTSGTPSPEAGAAGTTSQPAAPGPPSDDHEAWARDAHDADLARVAGAGDGADPLRVAAATAELERRAAAGCICEDPIGTRTEGGRHDDACPIAGHGKPPEEEKA